LVKRRENPKQKRLKKSGRPAGLKLELGLEEAGKHETVFLTETEWGKGVFLAKRAPPCDNQTEEGEGVKVPKMPGQILEKNFAPRAKKSMRRASMKEWTGPGGTANLKSPQWGGG